MADRAPLLFEPHLGMLRPANRTAQEALSALSGRVRAEIKGGASNERRRSLYWSVAALVVPILNDLHTMTLDDQDLHDITRQKLGVGEWLELPSGERRFKTASTSNRAMNEADRAAYTDKALALWSTWAGVDVATLKQEAALNG